MVHRRLKFRVLSWGAVAVVCSLTGCQRSAPLVLLPVAGKVTLSGKPLPRGTVSLRPDGARGNSSLHHPTGSIEADGSYKVYTIGRPGAPPGWYKAVVFASEEELKQTGVHPTLPRSIISQRYQTDASTPLAFEVTKDTAAGAYDLRLDP